MPSASEWTDEQVAGFLDEQLAPAEMSAIEDELRRSEPLRNRVAAAIRRRTQGAHSIAEIWRKHRLSCPSREELGRYLLGVLEPEAANYIEFHLRTIGCRYCLANLDDLEASRTDADSAIPRRKRFFETSAGYLKTGKK
ncbi:MAG TPA: hypothetical protein VLA12_09405 [Planctomycetaceae bacterium]|nr:hypothetical protein [Planctomycetaceae bacterium]